MMRCSGFVRSLSASWDRVGEAAGVPGKELRSASIHAVLVSVAHIRENVIRVVESPPWSLAIGDVKANLA